MPGIDITIKSTSTQAEAGLTRVNQQLQNFTRGGQQLEQRARAGRDAMQAMGGVAMLLGNQQFGAVIMNGMVAVNVLKDLGGATDLLKGKMTMLQGSLLLVAAAMAAITAYEGWKLSQAIEQEKASAEALQSTRERIAARFKVLEQERAYQIELASTAQEKADLESEQFYQRELRDLEKLRETAVITADEFERLYNTMLQVAAKRQDAPATEAQKEERQKDRQKKEGRTQEEIEAAKKRDVRQQMADMLQTLPTLAQSVAVSFRNVIGGAIQSVSQGIQGLINGTMTWGKALQTIGTGIITSVVEAIANMFAEFIVNMVLVQGLRRIFHGEQVAEGATTAAAWAPAAATVNAATYGSSASAGIPIMLALVMAAVGALSAMSFERGGYTGPGGVSQPAGLVHAGEFVMPQAAVNRIGLPALESLRQGGSAGGGRSVTQNINVLVDRRAWLEASRNDIAAIALDAYRRNRISLS